MKADFSGYASKAGLLCTDGRVIQPGAFKEKDQKKIPLVWQHRHDELENVLGHALVEDRDDGVYVYGFFNESDKAQTAKMAVQHGDLDSLSIYANRLEHQGNNVVHGNLVEVSLVLAGANPGAWIENVTLQHGDRIETLDDAATIWTPPEEALIHSGDEDEGDDEDEEFEDGDEDEEDDKEEEDDSDAELVDPADVVHSMNPQQRAVLNAFVGEALAHAGTTSEGTTMADDSTIEDVYNAMTDEQKTVVDFLVGSAVQDATSAAHSDLAHSQEGNTMTRVFDTELNGNSVTPNQKKLEHSQIKQILEDAKQPGFTLEKSVLAHADEYGITNIDLLFPDARTVGDMPNVLSRVADWVPKVIDGTRQIPFSTVKSIMADLTEEEARAKGYIKGNLKKDEVISLLKRETRSTTIYKKQRLDRDDIIDITDFDVVSWLKWEIRFMLNEEIARAILVGDGRPANSDDKIKDPMGQIDGVGIRSIANEHELFAVTIQIPVDAKEEDIIDAVAFSQEEYRGSGNPTYFTTNRNLTALLLQKDRVGRRLYDTEVALAAALRVKEIVTVPVMEEYDDLYGIIVNLTDYSVGTNRGGELNFFEDFDIDFNQNKYLLETRMSGALTKPKSAIILRKPRGTEVVPTAPSFVDNKITIPTQVGVEYRISGAVVTGVQTITKDTEVVAGQKSGYFIPRSATKTWGYSYTA